MFRNKRGIINYNLELKYFSRQNRKKPTSAELKLWNDILVKKKIGYKFLRQKPIDNFIVDFYCSKLLLVIEVDGDSHYKGDQIIYDQSRTDRFLLMNIKVLRYDNDQIINNIEGVYDNLSKQIKIRAKELGL